MDPAFRAPALLVAGCASGQGKTTLTAALAHYHARQGRRVRVLKAGPDFIDPMILRAASANPVYNIDCWMVGIEESSALLGAAARDADLVLVEGAMGLYDGEPSSADLATTFGLPVAVVIDASAMAQTFGALAKGLKDYRQLPFAGVIANRVAGPAHASMLAGSLPADIPLLLSLPEATSSLPERHLGLVRPAEVSEFRAILDELAGYVEDSGKTGLPPAVSFRAAGRASYPRLLAKRRIAIARDAAFSFLYPANIDCLHELGAQALFFSPLADQAVPDADALYLPGGYPELHAERLSANRHWNASVRAFARAGRPVLAECGGMMVLFESLQTGAREAFAMAGVLPGAVRMLERLAAIGLQQAEFPEGTVRGHTFHHSVLTTPLAPILRCVPHGHGTGEAVYRVGNVTASYLHSYFPSNPHAAAAFFGARA